MPFSTAIVGVIAGYIWLVEPYAPPWTQRIVAGIVLALAGWHARRTGEWGLARTAFLPGLRWALVTTLPALSAIVAIGALLGTLHPPPVGWWEIGFLVLWGTAQQFALQTVLLREAERRWSGGRAIWVAAAVFAALHLPNPLLVLLTFAGGAVWCAVYQRAPNILPLAMAHALGTLAVLAAFDERITGRLRTGWGYLAWLLD